MKHIKFTKSKVYYYNGKIKVERLRPSYRSNKNKLSIIKNKVSNIEKLYYYTMKIKYKIKLLFKLKEKYKVYVNTSENVLNSI